MTKVAEYNSQNRKYPVSLLVFHCFALPTSQMLRIFKQTDTGIHYIIKRNGKILPLVAEDKVTFHAGLSSWREFDSAINEQSIGIELQNSLMGQQKYTEAQTKSLISLAGDIIKKYGIKAQNIVGHSDIAPYRKPDPAQFFPWSTLAENGIGIWPKIQTADLKRHLSRKDVQKLLEEIGYDTSDATAALYAFTTRFLPQKVQARSNIITTEAEVFAYWRGVSLSEAPKRLKSAPKIYPATADDLWHDVDVWTRLLQVAAIYNRK